MTRSIAEQTVDELGGPRSVFVRQRNDHAELDRYLHELDGATGTAQDQVLRRINRLVFSHAFAEETVLWPVIRRVLPDGEALTLQVEEEHQEVNELVTRLETLPHGTEERAQVLTRLVEVLREDVRDEEDVMFPRLQEALDAPALRRLGWQWEVARQVSPTRPHPTVSRRPPGNAASGLPLSALDRSRDVLDAVAERAPGRLGPAAQTASRGLAAAAGWVERVPLSRRGDRPPTSR